MIRTLLFDLDGTLLPVDTREFLGHYLRLLGEFVAPKVDPQRFIKQIIDSTATMVSNTDPGKTNKEVFMEDFFPKMGLDASEWMPLFDEFYETWFPSLERVVKRDPMSRKVVEKAVERGFDLVIATNPVFPMKAIRQRMKWAGIDDFEYRLVTSYENMHFCKPQIGYYQEVLERIGRQPEECLMVGNDVQEDIAAKMIGIKTFLVDRFLIDRNGSSLASDYRGSL